MEKRHNNSQSMRKETHLCACWKGSYTLEMAVVLPLVAGFLIFLLFFFRVLQVQTSVQTALYYAGRMTACEASAVNSEVALLASAEGFFQKEVSKADAVGNYVSGGGIGISLLRSDFSGNHIELKADYFIKFPINFFSFRGIHVTQGAKSRKWTGDRQDGPPVDYVYVAENGTVYHCSRNCHYLDLSIRQTPAASLAGLRNQSGQTYGACPMCISGRAVPASVYVTDYGECYHASLSCSGLKRTVYLIPLSEVGGKGPCSKCGKTHADVP